MDAMLKSNIELGRLKGLSVNLQKVAANLPKFPYNEEIYTKHVNEFGGRKIAKKTKLLEEI